MTLLLSTSCQVIIARYDALINQSECTHLSYYQSNYIEHTLLSKIAKFIISRGGVGKAFFYLSSCLIMQWISFILIFVSFLLWQVLWILWLQEHCVTITKCKMEIFPKKGYPVSSLPARRKSIFMIERRQLLASQSNVNKGVNCHSAGGQISV